MVAVTGTSETTAPAATMSRRDQVAVAVFATWMITGLFVDGWAHVADKPETFFTPWHAVLYSGFGAANLYFFWEGRRERGGRLVPTINSGPERLTTIGLFGFAGAAVADMVWHQVFGVEVDVEALLSPTHLALMTGGLFMATGPVRAAWADGSERPSLHGFLPPLVCLTLSVALVSFFTQFESAFRLFDHDAFEAWADEGQQIHGILAILVSNALLMAPALWILRRWTPPPGTFTILFGGVALLMSGLQAFGEAALVVPALAGGGVADLLAARLRPGADNPRGARVFAVAVPVALWSAWFVTYHAVWGLGWPVELWMGSIVLAALTGVGLSLLAFPPPSRFRDMTHTPGG